MRSSSSATAFSYLDWASSRLPEFFSNAPVAVGRREIRLEVGVVWLVAGERFLDVERGLIGLSGLAQQTLGPQCLSDPVESLCTIAPKVRMVRELLESGVANGQAGMIFPEGLRVSIAELVDVADLDMRVDEVRFGGFVVAH